MADRNTHNQDVRRILGNRLTWKQIDEINKKIDSTVKTKGVKHREDYHSLNPLRPDSLEVTHGNPYAEIARQIHILRDTNPELRKLAHMQAALAEMRKVLRR